jgi:hypothetical protein
MAELPTSLGKAVVLLRQLRENCEPYKEEEFVKVHEGSCGPWAQCDADCMSNANMGSYNALLRRIDDFLKQFDECNN